jgi:hypothetical protein
MASIITATTTSGLTQSADNSGVLQLASGAGNLVTVPSVTGTAMVSGNMPTFSAYTTGAGATISSSQTKVTYDTEEWDTNNNFASSRFTPTVAGYYQINAQVQPNSSYTGGLIAIYKNGAAYRYGTFVNTAGIPFGGFTVSSLVFCNGSTDYIEIYAAFTTTQATGVGEVFSYFNGFLARAA